MSLSTVDRYWTERRFRAMGSTAHIVIGDAPTGLGDWAVAEVERLEQRWSRFRENSELEWLHAGAGEWTRVSASMLLAFTCARDLYAATTGRFDPTVRAALERAGYDRSFERVAPANVRDAAADGDDVVRAAVPGFGTVAIDVARASVRVPPGVRVDFGGLGKGLAADLVARGIDRPRRARSALVSLGGDMRARGELPDGCWRIPVEHPFDTGRIAFTHELGEHALVTSTRRFRAWTRGGRHFHHIIDPRTGDAARTSVIAVVATAPDAWWSEGIAKAIMIAGVEEGVTLARVTDVHAWLFLDDGDLIEVAP